MILLTIKNVGSGRVLRFIIWLIVHLSTKPKQKTRERWIGYRNLKQCVFKEIIVINRDCYWQLSLIFPVTRENIDIRRFIWWIIKWLFHWQLVIDYWVFIDGFFWTWSMLVIRFMIDSWLIYDLISDWFLIYYWL